MKVEIFEVTCYVTPVIFASREQATAAAAALTYGMYAKYENGQLIYVPCEPRVRRVVLDVPKKTMQVLAAPRQQLPAPKKGGAE